MEKKRTMLEKSIRMNLDITASYAAKATGWLVFGYIVLGILTIPALILVLVYIFLGFRQLFDKTLFGEEAYTCMLAPMSMKHIVIGKTIAACFWLTLGYMLIYICLGVSALLFQTFPMGGSAGAFLLQDTSGVFDAAGDGVIQKGEIVYERSSLMHLAASIVLAPLVALAESVFACGLFQLGFVVRHVLTPNRDRPMITVMVAFAGILAVLLVVAVLGGLHLLISGDDTTVWISLLEIVGLGGCGVGLLAAAIRLLEKKYSLC